MINALHLIWIIPCAMVFGYIMGAVLAADIDKWRCEQRCCDNCGDDDEDTDEYIYERED